MIDRDGEHERVDQQRGEAAARSPSADRRGRRRPAAPTTGTAGAWPGGASGAGGLSLQV